MYVAVKGGEAAILSSYRLLAEQRRGDLATPELSVTQIREQLKLAPISGIRVDPTGRPDAAFRAQNESALNAARFEVQKSWKALGEAEQEAIARSQVTSHPLGAKSTDETARCRGIPW